MINPILIIFLFLRDLPISTFLLVIIVIIFTLSLIILGIIYLENSNNSQDETLF